jgi:hypothetical protein
MPPSHFSFHPLWPPVWPAARDELWRARARSVYPERRRISSVSRYTAWSWTNKQTNSSVQFTHRESKTARGHFFIALSALRGWVYGNVYSFGGLECVCLSFANGAHFIFLRDVWIWTQRAVVASRCATNVATHLPTNLATHLPGNV